MGYIDLFMLFGNGFTNIYENIGRFASVWTHSLTHDARKSWMMLRIEDTPGFAFFTSGRRAPCGCTMVYSAKRLVRGARVGRLR